MLDLLFLFISRIIKFLIPRKVSKIKPIKASFAQYEQQIRSREILRTINQRTLIGQNPACKFKRDINMPKVSIVDFRLSDRNFKVFTSVYFHFSNFLKMFNFYFCGKIQSENCPRQRNIWFGIIRNLKNLFLCHNISSKDPGLTTKDENLEATVGKLFSRLF